jgi:hypothetical protein
LLLAKSKINFQKSSITLGTFLDSANAPLAAPLLT